MCVCVCALACVCQAAWKDVYTKEFPEVREQGHLPLPSPLCALVVCAFVCVCLYLCVPLSVYLCLVVPLFVFTFCRRAPPLMTKLAHYSFHTLFCVPLFVCLCLRAVFTISMLSASSPPFLPSHKGPNLPSVVPDSELRVHRRLTLVLCLILSSVCTR